MRKALIFLQSDHGISEFHGNSRVNDILGIGVFEIGDSYQFSLVSDDAIEGVLHNPPTLKAKACHSRCQQSITSLEGLKYLVFRHPTGSKNMMEFRSNRMQMLSDASGARVILKDAYYNRSYLWEPENDNARQ